MAARYKFRWLTSRFVVIEEPERQPIIISPDGLQELIRDIEEHCIFTTAAQRNLVFQKYTSALDYCERQQGQP